MKPITINQLEEMEASTHKMAETLVGDLRFRAYEVLAVLRMLHCACAASADPDRPSHHTRLWGVEQTCRATADTLTSESREVEGRLASLRALPDAGQPQMVALLNLADKLDRLLHETAHALRLLAANLEYVEDSGDEDCAWQAPGIAATLQALGDQLKFRAIQSEHAELRLHRAEEPAA